MNSKKVKANQQGVPRETPEYNNLEQFQNDLLPLLSDRVVKRLVNELVTEGYFDLSLMEQRNSVISKLLETDVGTKIMEQLIKSKSDKIKSLAVNLSFHYYRQEIDKELRFLYRAGSLTGTWTQETAQTVLKDYIHLHGFNNIVPKISHWVDDPDENVRRMLIEALRPRGVWCRHLDSLKKDPTTLKPIIKKLLDDKSLYVRKAVSNNLNDISKDNPDILCRWIAKWSGDNISMERRWILNRGLRTLVKNGYPLALRLLGFADPDNIKIIWKKTTPKSIEIGGHIPFHFKLTNIGNKPARAGLQLEMHCPGKGNNPRISKYKLGDLILAKGETKILEKRVRFAHKNSVPKLPGKYHLHIILNGKLVGKRSMIF